MKTIPLLIVLLATPATPAAAPATHRNGTIVKLEHAWLTAARHHDTATLAHILADDFIDINVHGQTRDKAAAMAAHAAPAGTTQTLRDIKVRHYGTSAIVTGINVVHSKTKGWTVQVAFTDVFVRRHDGKWQAVSAQETLRHSARRKASGP